MIKASILYSMQLQSWSKKETARKAGVYLNIFSYFDQPTKISNIKKLLNLFNVELAYTPTELKHLREANYIHASRFAREIGYDVRTIKRFESGEDSSIELYEAYCRMLNVSPLKYLTI